MAIKKRNGKRSKLCIIVIDNVPPLFYKGDMLPRRNPNESLKARGANTRPANRFNRLATEYSPDGWDIPEESTLLRTEVTDENPRSIITRNQSSDIPFDRSINPYRGCEHGCIYCYARPSHAYWGMSPGVDFETKITAKPSAPQLLIKEIARPGYEVSPIAFGTNTDPYQPVEAKRSIMPDLWQILLDWNHPAYLITRGQTVLRDLALLTQMAARRLIHVGVSITSLDPALCRIMEPRAPTPSTRLRMIRELSAAGIQVRVMVAPVIPVLTEPELEKILTAAREAGATHASMILIRLPHEVAPLFRDWLSRHRPDAAAHIMNKIRAMHSGQDNDPRYHKRMYGEGVEADLLHQRFRLARRRLGFAQTPPHLDCSRFGPPMSLQFD